MSNLFTRPEEKRMTNIIKQAVKMLNKERQMHLKVAKLDFAYGVDDKYPSGMLDTCVTITLQSTKTKKTIKLHYYESFFDADKPHSVDMAAGLAKVRNPETKALLRVAYSIGSNSIRRI